MAGKSFPRVQVVGEKRILNARKDTPDIRNGMYEPALIQLQPEIDNRGGTHILNQGTEGACTGFGLAARYCTLGACYRLRPEINDYHTALNEVGVIFVSADVHSGWFSPKAAKSNEPAIITPSNTIEGGHAFALVYRKSFLYLVSRALERNTDMPLLVMQRSTKKLSKHAGLSIHYSNSKKGITTSISHGGFDSDARSMNTIMAQILKKIRHNRSPLTR
ncbi:hypothetical protein [Desulfocastanea catecholica]